MLHQKVQRPTQIVVETFLNEGLIVPIGHEEILGLDLQLGVDLLQDFAVGVVVVG